MKKMFVLLTAMVLMVITGCSPSGWGPVSSAKAITAFSFASPAATGTITEATHTIAIAVPSGTDVTALVATFTTTGSSVAVGSTPQISGTTANDFTSSVVYTVTAADSSTQDYTVTVTVTVALNPAKAITAFTFPISTGTTIDEVAHTIAVTVPFGTVLTALVPAITHTGASISPQGSQNFSSPVNYTVTATDGTTQIYRVNVMAYNHLPKTGQTTSYATGDDGDLEKGVAWPGTRFTDNSNGTITDNLNGLVWLKNTSCFGQDTWANALTDANTLNSGECGLTDGSVEGDWRLPNREELRSLIDYSLSNTAAWLNGQGFSNLSENDGSGYYWSSTTCAAAAPTYAWIMNMATGRWTNTAKTDAIYYVWAVRSGPAGVVNLPKTGQTTSYATGDDGDLEKGVAWPTTRFTDNSNGTITDNLTGLVWLKNASCFGQPTWANALTDANTLNSGECGLTDESVEGDWRLPNANELESLINFQQSNPATWLNAQGFTGVQTAWHMVSTTNAADTSTYAWTIMMGNGNMDNLKIKANAADYVWPLRDAR